MCESEQSFIIIPGKALPYLGSFANSVHGKAAPAASMMGKNLDGNLKLGLQRGCLKLLEKSEELNKNREK